MSTAAPSNGRPASVAVAPTDLVSLTLNHYLTGSLLEHAATFGSQFVGRTFEIPQHLLSHTFEESTASPTADTAATATNSATSPLPAATNASASASAVTDSGETGGGYYDRSSFIVVDPHHSAASHAPLPPAAATTTTAAATTTAPASATASSGNVNWVSDPSVIAAIEQRDRKAAATATPATEAGHKKPHRHHKSSKAGAADPKSTPAGSGSGSSAQKLKPHATKAVPIPSAVAPAPTATAAPATPPTAGGSGSTPPSATTSLPPPLANPTSRFTYGNGQVDAVSIHKVKVEVTEFVPPPATTGSRSPPAVFEHKPGMIDSKHNSSHRTAATPPTAKTKSGAATSDELTVLGLIPLVHATTAAAGTNAKAAPSPQPVPPLQRVALDFDVSLRVNGLSGYWRKLDEYLLKAVATESKGRFMYRADAIAHVHFEFIIDAVGTLFLFPPAMYPITDVPTTAGGTAVHTSDKPPASPTPGTTTLQPRRYSNSLIRNPTSTISFIPNTAATTTAATTAAAAPTSVSFVTSTSFAPSYSAAVCLASPLCFALSSNDIKYELEAVKVSRDLSGAGLVSYLSPASWRDWLVEGIIGDRLRQSFVHVLSPVLCDQCITPFVRHVIQRLPATWHQFSVLKREHKKVSDEQSIRDAEYRAHLLHERAGKADLMRLTQHMENSLRAQLDAANARAAAAAAEREKAIAVERTRWENERRALTDKHHSVLSAAEAKAEAKAEARAKQQRDDELKRLKSKIADDAERTAAAATKAAVAAATASTKAAADAERKRSEEAAAALLKAAQQKEAAARAQIEAERQQRLKAASEHSQQLAATKAALSQKEAELTRIANDAKSIAANAKEHERLTREMESQRQALSELQTRLEKEKEEFENGKLCVVCLENKRDIVFTPCGHVCMCGDCAGSVSHPVTNCPMCRTAIVTKNQRVFL